MVFVVLSGQLSTLPLLRKSARVNQNQRPRFDERIITLICTKREATGSVEDIKAESSNSVSEKNNREMATDLGDPDFCPPRQVRQGQGRGSVYEILSMQGALRFRGARDSCPPTNSSPEPQKHVVLREASFVKNGEVSRKVRRTPSFPVYCPDRQSNCSASEKTMEEDHSEYDNLPDKAYEDRVIPLNSSENFANRSPSGGKVKETSFPSQHSTDISNERQTKAATPEKKRNRDTKFEDSSKGTTQRSQSWVWKHEEMIQSAATSDLASNILEVQPSQDSGLITTSPIDGDTLDSNPESASSRIFHARVVSCDEKKTKKDRNDTNHNLASAPEGDDDSAWFGSGVNSENAILPGGLLHIKSQSVSGLGAAQSDPGLRHQDSILLSTFDSASFNDDRSSIMTEMSSSQNSHVTEVSSDSQELREALEGRPEEALATSTPKIWSAHPDYDSETLRRAAATNREVSRKLFSKLREQQEQRSNRLSPRHERQYSGLSGGSSEGGDSPVVKRSLTKSPSQLSSTGASSIYAESSSGSSGIGTLSQTASSTKEYARDPPIQRSTSSETLTNTAYPSSGAQWNKPQQRRNIMSMVYEGDTAYLPMAMTPPHQDQGYSGDSGTHSHRTSSAAASRGVFRKISSRKRAAREESAIECMKSLPDLSLQGDQEITLHQESGLCGQRYWEAQNSNEANKSVLAEANAEYLAENCESTNRAEKDHNQRSRSPIYAVPNKVESPGSDSCSNFGVSVSTTHLELMKSPPPLPRKPPPPLRHLPNSSHKYSSTPCLFNEDRELDKAMTTNRNKSFSAVSRGEMAWPSVAGVRARFISPQTLPSAPVPNPNHSSPMGGGKPTVEVHPMCQTSSLSVSVDGRKEADEGQSGASPPRPPVPKKPQFLSPSSSPSTPPATSTGGPSARKLEQLNYLDEKCTRLSQFVSDNDETLAGILKPNHLLPLDCLGGQLTNGHPETSAPTSSQSAPLSPSSAYYTTSTTKAKFLVNIYRSTLSPGISNLNSQSVDGCDSFQLERKKLELIGSLSRKLKILDEEQKAIGEEVEMNEKLGERIQEWVHGSSATHPQRDKLRLHLDDTQRITCLLLRLSGQIARVENAINKLPPHPNHSEKALLVERRERLVGQREDARALQTSLERRGEQVLGFLREVLGAEEVGDYQYFIQMKKKLLVDAKEIQDKIKLGTEQKEALESSLHNNSFLSQSTASFIP